MTLCNTSANKMVVVNVRTSNMRASDLWVMLSFQWITLQRAARYQDKNLFPQFELLLMKWLIGLVITLLSHITRQGRLISMVTDRTHVIALSPKLSTPKQLLDFRHLPENLSGCYAFMVCTTF